jgi:D-proline reductase (dithiol) PrdB
MPIEHVEYMEAITKRYSALGYAPYGWIQADSPPALTPLAKPLNECRIGMMSTSGAYVKGQTAYFYKDDTSTRAIPKNTPKDDIHFSHITENYLEDPRRDPDCILPLTALRRLEAEGVIGDLADEVYSCMGGIYSQRRVIEELIPDLTANFRAQKVDAAFLVAM